MRFPLLSSLALPCVFEALVPGKLHPDGRRYLPLIVLRPSQAPAGGVTPAGLRLGVVDRHHRVDEAYVGRAGVARLVCALSALRLQGQPHRAGLQPEAGWAAGRPSAAPTIYGRVGEVAAWEEGGGQLPYQTLYAALGAVNDGLGRVGLPRLEEVVALGLQVRGVRFDDLRLLIEGVHALRVGLVGRLEVLTRGPDERLESISSAISANIFR